MHAEKGVLDSTSGAMSARVQCTVPIHQSHVLDEHTYPACTILAQVSRPVLLYYRVSAGSALGSVALRPARFPPRLVI